MLSVRRGAKAVEFYKSAFGARELFRIGDDSGGVVAQLAVAESEFWVADESPEHYARLTFLLVAILRRSLSH
jgi:PhnB protein